MTCCNAISPPCLPSVPSGLLYYPHDPRQRQHYSWLLLSEAVETAVILTVMSVLDGEIFENGLPSVSSRTKKNKTQIWNRLPHSHADCYFWHVCMKRFVVVLAILGVFVMRPKFRTYMVAHLLRSLLKQQNKVVLVEKLQFGGACLLTSPSLLEKCVTFEFRILFIIWQATCSGNTRTEK